MCRNIKRLRHPEHPPSDEELHDAALQFVRKISGFNAPSQANREVFDRAVDAITEATAELLAGLEVRGQTAPAHSRAG